MAIEFNRMKLRRKGNAPVQLAGNAVLHLDGGIDLFGDAMDHAATIGASVEGADAMKPLADLPPEQVTAADCTGCSLAAASGPSCRCLQVDRFRVGEHTSLAPMILRPGLPVAIHRHAEADVTRNLWREFAVFRAVRALGNVQAA
ncbi:hypothetical protein [Azospirillum soli]|uniref:hypothetical protein n=1 Tax=Azospirillum soli TaxID=1304799 RepID=UPI001AE24F29|nr:hypothetical protein [Azospirillum soli]MBP2313747.1 hypothetical protein [Azospirillum soli]